MSLFMQTYTKKMLEKHQSALLQTFNKKDAYLSKIQVHRNSFVWRNGFHYSPHPIELHFMKFKWSFFLITRSDAWRLLNLITSICHFLNGFLQCLFFFIEVFGYVIFVHCLLSRKDIAHFFSVNRIRCVWKHWDFNYLFFVKSPKNKDSKAFLDRLGRIFERGLLRLGK